MTVLKNCTLELQYKVFIWGVWVNFLNKINEKIEFELRNSNNKLKIRLSEEDKTVSSRNLKIRYFEVFFSDKKMDKYNFFLEMFEKFFLKNTTKSIHEGGLVKFQPQNY